MTFSCLSLEQPGRWRGGATGVIFLIAALPLFPLLWLAIPSPGRETGDFALWDGLRNALWLASGASAIGLIVGLPLGVLSALYEFRGRTMLLALVALPLLMPSLLWAIGWSSAIPRLGGAPPSRFAFAGGVHVFALATIPLVLFTAAAATRGVSGSQLDAARLAGGETTALVSACRHAALPSILAAVLAGILTLADPGPGQILGIPTAAAQILTSFAAHYDAARAGRQCVLLTLAVLSMSAPLAWLVAHRFAPVILVKQPYGVRRSGHRGMRTIAALALVTVLALGLIMPLSGLLAPLLDVGSEAGRDAFLGKHPVLVLPAMGGAAFNTVLYALGAGIIGTSLGVLLAACVGRDVRLRRLSLGMAVALVCWPPATAAIGIAYLVTQAPAWADVLSRGRVMVCVALGLRLFPVAAVIALRAWGMGPPSWTLVAALHGVPFSTYVRRVWGPYLAPSLALALLLIGLLASADVSTVLLLHPPGEPSMTLAIFTVMANAPEWTVASMCLAYLSLTAVALSVGLALAARLR